ncbi:hypothetical protein GCM10010238_59160 [Streptomyces griseoviridis]|uniref:Uncharacterized protein n=1 Tax=Streptomyces griseoviridis TaxID=45398 RepID=A0A918LKR3_STRGD|nr:hypothetical protein GCM10010238_59160 [Streptomyces niveoruber]
MRVVGGEHEHRVEVVGEHVRAALVEVDGVAEEAPRVVAAALGRIRTGDGPGGPRAVGRRGELGALADATTPRRSSGPGAVMVHPFVAGR